MKLTGAEKCFYERVEKSAGQDVTIAELADAFYIPGKRVKPKNWRGSVAAIMRTVILKCQASRDLKMISRTSTLGRSSQATYKMEV